MKKIVCLLLPIVFFVFSCSSDSPDEPEEMQEEQMMEEEMMEEEEEEIICDPPSGFSAENVTQDSAALFWNPGQGAQLTIIEYGLEGFTVGSGEIVTHPNGFINIENLLAGNSYDVYFSSDCESDTSSELVGPIQFETLPVCVAPLDFILSNTQSTSISVNWQPYPNTTAWELEYGIVGFELGTGTTIQTSNTFFEIDSLVPSTTYEVYVRTNCGSEGFSEYLDPIVATTDGFGDLFTGQYLVTQSANTPSAVLGANVFGIDDQNGLVVTLFGPNQAPSQTIEGVSVSETERAFDGRYAEAVNIGSVATYVVNFANGQVVLSQNEEVTGVGCGGEILFLGPPIGALGSYVDDNQFIFNFQEDVLDTCINPVDITLTFTKL